MDLEQLQREAEKKRAAYERKRAKSIHEGSSQLVTARMNELHHLMGLTIDLALFEAERHEQLEAELVEAVNRARELVDEASGSGGAAHARVDGKRVQRPVERTPALCQRATRLT